MLDEILRGGLKFSFYDHGFNVKKKSTGSVSQIKTALRACVDPKKAEFYPRFFKTGPGEYGEGDRFLGVTVPFIRKTAKQFRNLSFPDTSHLLVSPIHEERMIALFILILQFERGGKVEKKDIRIVSLPSRVRQ